MFNWDARRGLASLERTFWVSDHNHILYHQERVVGKVSLYPQQILYHTDDELQGLIQLFLHYGIPTTPSQVGMRPTDKQIESMWRALQRDEKRIKTIGLTLTNTETGEEQSWYDRDFSFDLNKQNYIWSLVGQELGYAGCLLPKVVAERIVNTLQEKMPPQTKITIWKEVSPNLYATGIENLSMNQKHTWNYITHLIHHYITHHHLLSQLTEVE
jgi:hypothetical protein